MKITTRQRGSHSFTVILADDGSVMDYAEGIKAIRSKFAMTTQQLADAVGVSRRTVEGWEQGRPPSALALRILATLI